MRYANECRWIWSKGGIVFEITRPGVGSPNAEEERSFAEIRQYAQDHGINIPQVANDVEGHPEVAAIEVQHRAALHFGNGTPASV